MNIEEKLYNALCGESDSTGTGTSTDATTDTVEQPTTNVEDIDLTKIDEMDDEALDGMLTLLKSDGKISEEFTVSQIRTGVEDEKKRRQATSLVRQIALVSVYHIFKKKSEMHQDNSNFKLLLSKFNIRKLKALSGEQYDFINESKENDCLYMIVKPIFDSSGSSSGSNASTRTYLDSVVRKFDQRTSKIIVDKGLKMLEYTYNYYTDFYASNIKLLESIAAANGEEVSNYMMRINNETLDLCVGFPDIWFRIGLFTVFKSDGVQAMQGLYFDNW